MAVSVRVKVAVLDQVAVATSAAATAMTVVVDQAAAAAVTTTRIFTGKDVTTKARLISKPEPQYTEDARKNQVTGTVVLKVVFASNGSVHEHQDCFGSAVRVD